MIVSGSLAGKVVWKTHKSRWQSSKTWQQMDFTSRDSFWKSFAPTCGISCPSLWMASFQTRFFASEVGLMWRPCYHKNLFYSQNKSINTNRAYRRFLSKKQTRFFEDCSFRMWKKTGCASRCITHIGIDIILYSGTYARQHVWYHQLYGLRLCLLRM